MGDRANFGFVDGDNTIFLYGHWAGEGMMGNLAHALQEVVYNGRAHDFNYGNRIAISQLIGTSWNEGLGWGISVNYVCDNEHTIPIVDLANDTVKLVEYDNWGTHNFSDPKVTFSIEGFIKKFG